MTDAIERKDGDDLELALIVCNTFGFSANHLNSLIALTTADWHYKHEDVVAALGGLGDPAAVDTLYTATQWVPTYLDFDEARALARKAVYALGALSGEEADNALRRVLESEDAIVREFAEEQIARRG
ncbi:HEAT repeat domain-containing protein [Kribbella lupini]|uniref:HEAT repeat domain-containing protein n=1 Tax=Kribbella lupini TaxID=291602 RepID=UPI0031D8A0E0